MGQNLPGGGGPGQLSLEWGLQSLSRHSLAPTHTPKLLGAEAAPYSRLAQFLAEEAGE